jgi:hypothetical protein
LKKSQTTRAGARQILFPNTVLESDEQKTNEEKISTFSTPSASKKDTISRN